jgi:phosphatidylglycerol:prolipoprotein diacylglycerol transferase
MYPILFEFGNFRIYSYGAMVAFGFLTAIYFTSREARRTGIAHQKIFDIGLYAILSGIIGARFLHILLEFQHYVNRPFDAILINRGGLAFHGGLLTGILAAWFFIERNKMPLWKTADIFAPYIALGQAIGRIGCFLNGCCYGRPTNLAIGIHLPGHMFRLHPVQLYSSIFLILVFVLLKKVYKNKRFDGAVFFSYLIMFSFGRFFVDFFRGDLRTILFGLTTSQFISIGIFAMAFFFLVMRSRNKI